MPAAGRDEPPVRVRAAVRHRRHRRRSEQLRVGGVDRSILDGLTREIAALSSTALGGSRPHQAASASTSTRSSRRSGANASRGPKVDQHARYFAVPSAPFRRAGDLPRVRRADVRPAGAGVPGRHHPRHLVHDGAREHQPVVQRDRAARGAPLDVAPRSRNNPDKMPWDFTCAAQAEHFRYHVDTLAYYLSTGCSRSRNTTATARCSTPPWFLYGSGMSDGNIHNNYNVPVVVVGGPETRICKGNRHLVSIRRGRVRSPKCCRSA